MLEMDKPPNKTGSPRDSDSKQLSRQEDAFAQQYKFVVLCASGVFWTQTRRSVDTQST